mmetsp:Transcript_88258/g.248479  ORF Transcript_88258/g.248479 Transcript_88258/m.248479 type:complete len:512 (-) Transcript_88258:134-1669(-)
MAVLAASASSAATWELVAPPAATAQPIARPLRVPGSPAEFAARRPPTISSVVQPSLSWSPTPSAPRPLATSQSLSEKVPARLLAELREAQGASELEARLLTGLTDLFEELAGEERRRRTAWEERAERAQRELRASVDADLARGACESRRFLAEAKRDAGEARKLVQPCQELVSALERQELPPSFQQLIRREVQALTSAESERMLQSLGPLLTASVKAASKEHAGQLAQEHAGQFTKAIEKSFAEVEARAKLSREEVLSAAQEVEGRVTVRLKDLQEAHSTLQDVLDKYADRWERAWREEADARAQGDQASTQRIDVVARANEAQARALEASMQRVGLENSHRAAAIESSLVDFRGQVRSAVEMEANERQSAEKRIEVDLQRLRGELHREASDQAGTNGQLASGFEQLKGIVEQVLRLVSKDDSRLAMVEQATTARTSPPSFGRVGLDALITSAATEAPTFASSLLVPAPSIAEHLAAAASSGSQSPPSPPNSAFPTSAPGSPVLGLRSMLT